MVGVAIHQPHNSLTAVDLAVVNVIAQRDQCTAGVLYRIQLYNRSGRICHTLSRFIIIVNVDVTRAGCLLQGLFQ